MSCDDEYVFDDEDDYVGTADAEYKFDDDDNGQTWDMDDDGLAQVAPKKFETLTAPQALVEINKLEADAAELLRWSMTSAMLLLRHFNWNLAKLQERYFEDSKGAMEEAGVAGSTLGVWKATTKRKKCCVCWEAITACEAGGLSCGHIACLECWRQYLRTQLETKANAVVAVHCLESRCPQVCGRPSFAAIFGAAGPETVKFDDRMVRSFVEAQPQIRRCRNPYCDSLLRCYAARIPRDYSMCTCHTCGTSFCFSCGEDDHGPASCVMLKEWKEKEVNEAETMNWVSAHTKPCPGKTCGQATEKNGGCNHMTCIKCKHEWCWVCEGDWAKHGTSWYNCNQFNSNDAKDKEKKRAEARNDVERYLHYYTRYRNHQMSRDLDCKVLKKTRQRMNDALSNNDGSRVTDVEYLEKTAEVLLLCRRTLMYTYVFAYYITDSTKKRLFEYNQCQLEFATEQLSKFIEDDKSERQAVVNHTSAAAGFLEKMKEGNSSVE